MRFGIDARFYGPVGKGLGRYTQKLIENLEKIDQTNEYFIFLRHDNWDVYRPQAKNFKKVLADWRWYTLAEQIFMPFRVWRQKLDVMHFPHFNVPIFYGGKFVVTIHDLILTQYPTQRASTLGPWLYKLKHSAYNIVIKSAIKRAARVIAVSEYTKKELINYFKVDPTKIIVTYESVDIEEIGRPERGNSVLKKYKIKRP